MRIQTGLVKAAQPVPPVNFKVPAGACDCHTHIHGDPDKFPFFPRRVYTPEIRKKILVNNPARLYAF